MPSLTKLLTNPTLAVTGNLRWTRSGVVYAEWLLTARPGGYQSGGDKRGVAASHRHLFNDLGRTTFSSVVAPIDTAVIAARITKPGYPYRPEYLQEVSAQLDAIDARQPPERINWLSVPLCAPASTGHLDDDFEPTAADRARFQALAAAVERKIPGIFDPRPATPAQMHWMWTHAHVRGVAPTPFPHSTAPKLIRRAYGFRCAGALEMAKDAVKVTLTESDIPPSYQTFLVAEDFPTALPWPGVADQLFPLLNHFDTLGIDYTLRTRTRPRPEALAANARALRQLSEQVDERDGEVSFAHNFLVSRGRMLTQYNNHLEANPAETELAFCPIIALSSDEPGHLEDVVRDVTRTFHDNGVTLKALPAGAQAELWAASQPGYPSNRASRDYSHIMATDSFGRFMPITAPAIGDTSGPIIGRNRSSGFDEPVHFDLLGITQKDKSASFMATGELGSGKSVLLKVIFLLVTDLGGRVWLVDRTKEGEYTAPARSIAAAVVLDVANPTHTMDPLRVFTGPDAAEYALSVLMPLFDIHAGSPESTLLSDLLDPNYRARYRIASLPDLTAHLARLVADPARAAAIPAGATPQSLAALAGQLRFWAQRTFARVLFAPELPPLPLDATIVVLRTHRLQLPDENEDPRDQPVKLFGETMYALFAVIAQQALFTAPEFGLLTLDEASYLLRSTVGRAVVNSFVLEGRRANAAIGLASQAPSHFGDSVRLIPTRFAFRQTDESLAKETARFMGAADDSADGTSDSTDLALHEELVTKLMTDTSPPTEAGGKAAPHRRGECLMRDVAGRLADVKIDLPARPERAAAVLTTPTPNRQEEVA